MRRTDDYVKRRKTDEKYALGIEVGRGNRVPFS